LSGRGRPPYIGNQEGRVVAESALVRREVYYSGRVQGVGFRYTVRAIAVGYAVAGYVRNLADGRVQLVAEGPADQVAGLLDEVRTAMGRYVRDAQVTELTATGRLNGFEVRH
jgi:acylphosphatase